MKELFKNKQNIFVVETPEIDIKFRKLLRISGAVWCDGDSYKESFSEVRDFPIIYYPFEGIWDNYYNLHTLINDKGLKPEVINAQDLLAKYTSVKYLI
jgi:hypothetical protein